MRKNILCSLAVLALAGLQLARAAETDGADPEAWRTEARRAFAEKRFGIFIHWGLYSAYAQGEWYLLNGHLDERAYARMADGFCPSRFDAREWAKVFREAGAKYVTITTRHHDGFSLWPTRADDGYNIANTPFRRDILGELAEACRAEGLQLNFYYSLMDWHRGDYPPGTTARGVELPDRKPDYASYKRFMLAQLGELLADYRPGVIWFDGEWDHAKHRDDGIWARTLDWGFDEIYDFIHARGALVANNNHQPMRPKEDIQLFERDLPGENTDAGFSLHQPVTADRPIEQCDVVQRGVWGYRIAEKDFRTADDVVRLLARAAAKGSNLLLNIGPDASGRLPERAVEVLRGTGAWLKANGESIYGTEGCPVADGKAVVSTRRGNVLYLHFLDPAKTEFTFAFNDEIASATLLREGSPADVARGPDGKVRVRIVRAPGDPFDIVVRIEAEAR